MTILEPIYTKDISNLDAIVMQSLREEYVKLAETLGDIYTHETVNSLTEASLRFRIQAKKQRLEDKPRIDALNAKITAKEAELGLVKGQLVEFPRNNRMEVGKYIGMSYVEPRGNISRPEDERFVCRVQFHGRHRQVIATRIRPVAGYTPTLNSEWFPSGKTMSVQYNHHEHTLAVSTDESGYQHYDLNELDQDVYYQVAWVLLSYKWLTDWDEIDWVCHRTGNLVKTEVTNYRLSTHH